jgi:hypothetical protein
MEPVFMVMGQSSAVAASLAIDKKTSVQSIDVKLIQQVLLSNPLADGSTPDILIDNDNTNNVVQTGEWEKIDSRNSYASSWLQTTTKQDEAAVKFIPVIPADKKYKAYTYLPKISGASSAIFINVFDGKKTGEVVLDQKNLKVEGQTSGEWVYIGAYNFKKGNKNFISITNKNADGIIIADAVLLVPER